MAQIDTETINRKRAAISERRGGAFVGFNDPDLSELVPHNPDQEPRGASGTRSGFLFGGQIYPNANAARNANLPPLPGNRDN